MFGRRPQEPRCLCEGRPSRALRGRGGRRRAGSARAHDWARRRAEPFRGRGGGGRGRGRGRSPLPRGSRHGDRAGLTAAGARRWVSEGEKAKQRIYGTDCLPGWLSKLYWTPSRTFRSEALKNMALWIIFVTKNEVLNHYFRARVRSQTWKTLRIPGFYLLAPCP